MGAALRLDGWAVAWAEGSPRVHMLVDPLRTREADELDLRSAARAVERSDCIPQQGLRALGRKPEADPSQEI